MILVFTIIAAAYSCRMLAMSDIGGDCISYIRAALYLLLFALWGLFPRPAHYTDAGAALHAFDSCSDACVACFAHTEI